MKVFRQQRRLVLLPVLSFLVSLVFFAAFVDAPEATLRIREVPGGVDGDPWDWGDSPRPGTSLDARYISHDSFQVILLRLTVSALLRWWI